MIVRLEGRSAAADGGTPGIGNTRDGVAGGTLANRLVEPQTMSASGQGLPFRLRGLHDRCSPDSCRLAAPPKSAESGHVWTAPGWQGFSLRVQQWSEQPCVRPVSAVHVTAGHNALP